MWCLLWHAFIFEFLSLLVGAVFAPLIEMVQVISLFSSLTQLSSSFFVSFKVGTCPLTSLGWQYPLRSKFGFFVQNFFARFANPCRSHLRDVSRCRYAANVYVWSSPLPQALTFIVVCFSSGAHELRFWPLGLSHV